MCKYLSARQVDLAWALNLAYAHSHARLSLPGTVHLSAKCGAFKREPKVGLQQDPGRVDEVGVPSQPLERQERAETQWDPSLATA